MNLNFKLLISLMVLLTCKLISIETPETLIVKTLKKGEIIKKTLEKQDVILVNYTGWIFDKNKETDYHCDAKGRMFDSNIMEKFNHVQPFEFRFGTGTVIKGWDIGLEGMKVNEKRCLVIPPRLAYGNRKIGNIIEPNSTLIFEVQLIENLKNIGSKN